MGSTGEHNQTSGDASPAGNDMATPAGASATPPGGQPASEQRAPAQPAPAQLPTVGEMLGAGWRSFASHWRPALGITLVTIGIPAGIVFTIVPGLGTVLATYATSDDDESFADALSGLPFATIAWLLLACLILLLGFTIWSLASVALLTGTEAERAERTGFDATMPAVKQALHHWFRFALLMIGIDLAEEVVIVVAIIALAVAAAIWPPLAVVLFVGTLAALIVLDLKLAFIPFTMVEGDPHPVSKSWRCSNGHIWSLVGHFIVLGLAMAVLNAPSFAITVVAADGLGTIDSTGVLPSFSFGQRIAMGAAAMGLFTLSQFLAWFRYPALATLYRPLANR